jgi:hypothetical protein
MAARSEMTLTGLRLCIVAGSASVFPTVQSMRTSGLVNQNPTKATSRARTSRSFSGAFVDANHGCSHSHQPVKWLIRLKITTGYTVQHRPR